MSDTKQLCEEIYSKFNKEYFNILKRDEIGSIYTNIESETMNYDYNYQTALDDENQYKNRYGNVLADEKSRFISKNVPYINANVMDEYIMAQGPINICDFYNMLFDGKVKVIVCLTKEVENGMVKFNKYYDDLKETTFNDGSNNKLSFTVKTDVNRENNITIRKLNVIKVEEGYDDVKMEFIQIQYTGWPDYGCPEFDNIKDILKICDSINEIIAPNNGPLVVHCSAGIGRTGSFCLIRKCIEKFRRIFEGKDVVDKTFTIDLPSSLKTMRKFRKGLVVDSEQLLFCYQAVHTGIHNLLNQV